MNWIKRDLEEVIKSQKNGLELFPIWLLLGPRQVGKTSLLKHCSDQSRKLITLDDFNTRTQANQNPQLFLSSIKPPFLIDEIQYAPVLLTEIKKMVDAGNYPPGSIWLTGSQNFSVMKNVRESLAGRVAILNLFGFSDAEKTQGSISDFNFNTVIESSFPKLYGVSNTESRATYLQSYVQTYIEKDVIELGGISKRREFEIFVKMCALRTGQILELASLAKDAGISPVTAKEWISVLEDSFLIRLVHPYFNNRNKRLIKSPKLYFIDAGLCAYLAGWRDVDQLTFGPMSGAFFETHVFGQLLRFFTHHHQEYQIHFWRTKDQEEIDFLIETKSKIFPVEVKVNSLNLGKLANLNKIRESHWQPGTIISTRPGIVSQNGWEQVMDIQEAINSTIYS